MQKNKIQVFSIIVYCIAFLLFVYSVWAVVNTSQYISELVQAGQLVLNGNEFDIISFHISTYGQYLLFAILLFMSGWILQKVTAKVDVKVEVEEPAATVVEMPVEE